MTTGMRSSSSRDIVRELERRRAARERARGTTRLDDEDDEDDGEDGTTRFVDAVETMTGDDDDERMAESSSASSPPITDARGTARVEIEIEINQSNHARATSIGRHPETNRRRRDDERTKSRRTNERIPIPRRPRRPRPDLVIVANTRVDAHECRKGREASSGRHPSPKPYPKPWHQHPDVPDCS